MKVKKIAAVAAATGGLILAGAGAAAAHGGASAHGVTAGSPGTASGNSVQAPVHIPLNLCGNTVSLSGALSPAFGNSCANV